MAKYGDIVAAQTIGDYGNTGGSNFTNTWDSTPQQNLSVVSDLVSPSGKAIKITNNGASSSRTFFRWNGINADPERANSTSIALIRIKNSPSGTSASFGGLVARGTGTSSTETGVTNLYGRSGGTNSSVVKSNIYNNSSATVLTGTESNIWAQEGLYWQKLVVNGSTATSYLYAENSLNVPSDGVFLSKLTATPPASNADNYHGLFAFAAETDYEVLYFAIGTGADLPDPPAGSGADVSFTMPQFSVSASAENSAPTAGASVSFTMPQFSVSASGSSAAPDDITLIVDIDSGNVSSTLSSIVNPGTLTPRLNLFARPATTTGTNGSGWRRMIFAIENAEGRSPVFALDRADMADRANTPTSTWLPMYTQDDPSSINPTYTYAESRTLVGGNTGTIEFSFPNPLPAGRIYVMTHPMGTTAQAATLANDLLTNYPGVVTPTSSADASGVYYTTIAEVDENGRQIGGHPTYAFKAEFGGSTTDGGPKRKLLMISGVHSAGEHTSFTCFLSCLKYILDSPNADAIALRANWDVYCYFNVTANGLFGGHRRHNFRNNIDPNRSYPNGIEEISALTTAILSDTGGAVDVSFDWHCFASATQDFISWAQDTPQARRFVELGEAIFGSPARDGGIYSSATDTSTGWTRNTLGAKYSVAAEIQQRGSTSYSNYQLVGENWAKTLAATDADGQFFSGATASFTMPQFSVSISADNAAPSSGATVSFTMPQFVASVAAENTVPAFAADVAFSMPQFTAAVTGESFISGNLATVSFVMPQFTVSASVDKTVPEITAAAAFTMPQFTVSVFSGEFEYFNAPGTTITYIAESTEITYNP